MRSLPFVLAIAATICLDLAVGAIRLRWKTLRTIRLASAHAEARQLSPVLSGVA